MKIKILALFAAAALVISLSACGGGNTSGGASSQEPAAPPDLTGEWKQVNSNSEDSWQSATISDGTIEVFWVSDNGDTTALYWAGTYAAPETADEPQSWDSENDHEKADLALLASGDDTKTFTYENGQISHSLSAMGTTMTVRMERSN